MAKSHLELVTPAKHRTVTPVRRPNAELRAREYLTDAEVERLTSAAKTNRHHPHMLRHACGFALANKGHDTRALQAYPKAYPGAQEHPAHGALCRAGAGQVQGLLEIERGRFYS